MLRTNLSTRPFYNERGVRAGLAALFALAIGLTLFNAFEIIRLQGQSRDSRETIARNEAQAVDLREKARVIRRSIDRTKLDAVQVAASEANALIDRRTFSWTELINQFEVTLPPDVRIAGCRKVTRPAAGSSRSQCFRAVSRTWRSSWTRSRRPASSPACCHDRIRLTRRGPSAPSCRRTTCRRRRPAGPPRRLNQARRHRKPAERLAMRVPGGANEGAVHIRR